MTPQPALQSYTKQHLKRLFISGDDSDVTVVATSRQYALHHIHVCPRSPVFLKNCHFKKDHQPDTTLSPAHRNLAKCGGLLDLSPEDPHAVDCLLHFLYLDDYNPSSYSAELQARDPAQEQKGSPSHDNERTENHPLLLHARVSALAECYDIPELKQLALSKFKAATPPRWLDIEDVPGFLAVVREVYTSTRDSDVNLRAAVANIFHEHTKQLLRVREVQNMLVEHGALGRDILLQSIL
ncbi:BTB/POZ domain-containing protein [Metarhizium guizhouense ARSEF 977]|uniref:BTB/POZ domain-containing protein n=1 Tax=Metarhizium guizhouense (strain ARSEF 977) TaxID=1276136 RepID=A0A0B4G6R4_METGA|nr:BTB/POZ domain-containing protein [Metarhizium guizhouense ARSEF 977]